MNKAELIDRIAKDTRMSKSHCERVVNSMIDNVCKTVKGGREVRLVGFGTFLRGNRKARTGRNPQTGRQIKIPAMRVPRFKAGKAFKDLVR